jgi:prepilin-type N-terminal cleavage/methylation domain-containing protein
MRSQPQTNRGFTLAELLVAVAITSMIVVFLGSMFTSLASTSLRAHERTDAFRDARAALQMMARDFSAVVRTQWEPNPFTNPSPTSTPQPTTRPVAYLALKNIYSDPVSTNQQIYGLIAAKNAATGDVCSVGYYSSWDGKAYTLRRFFRDSAATHAAISAKATYASESDLFQPNPTGTQPDDVLAQYVWNLNVKPFAADGTALTYPYICDASAASPAPPIAAIEISFTAMSAAAARTLMSVTSSPKDWTDTASSHYVRLIKPHAYQFRTRIEL